MSAEFVASASQAGQFPREGLAEIAFAGRSNVGKSSLLNALLLWGNKRAGRHPALDRKKLARVSRTPGRTRTLNFYRIEGAFYFVDLPGYGCRLNRSTQRQLKMADVQELPPGTLYPNSGRCAGSLAVCRRHDFPGECGERGGGGSHGRALWRHHEALGDGVF